MKPQEGIIYYDKWMLKPIELIQDGVKFLSKDGISWWKDKQNKGKNFTYYKCRCGKLVSNCGWGFHKHKQKCKQK